MSAAAPAAAAAAKAYTEFNATSILLAPDSNQALGIAQYAIEFIQGTLGAGADPSVLKRTELFHTDALICGLSALAMRANAPTVLREEALEVYSAGATEHPLRKATVFGSKTQVQVEKAIVANASAVREWDSNGTVFGYNEALGHTAGEFGHNDFYPVCVAACQLQGLDGSTALRAMLCLDEIRGRLAEVFSLKSYKIDHTVHGAVGSAAVFGALMGATAEQIESAIGMTVAHYIPYRAIRAGHQLSDSKGASAALSTEVAIMSTLRSMRGFQGPRDIFRNPQAVFCLNEPTEGDRSPFRIVLSHSGTDFAVMGMHFKLGLYEHQSAGALQGVIDVIAAHPEVVTEGAIQSIGIEIYEPAFGIIGDPAKRNPTTRQSADHSMVFIVGSLLRHARALGPDGIAKIATDKDALWKALILTPQDYGKDGLYDAVTREFMSKIEFHHGGKEYDDKYPRGIPTSVTVQTTAGDKWTSGLVEFPSGHAANKTADLEGILDNKFRTLGKLAVGEGKVDDLLAKVTGLEAKSAADVQALYDCELVFSAEPIDGTA